MPEYPSNGAGALAGTTNTKNAVKGASTTNHSVTAFSGSTIDGGSVSLTVGDRILLKNQNTASQNGIWLFQGAAAALTRPTDFASGTQQAGASVAVTTGTANGGSFWELAVASAVVDTDSQTWVESAVAFDAVAPTTSAVGDAAAAGSATAAAHRDHTHGREAFGAVTAQAATNAASANGTAATLAHSDHTHGTPPSTGNGAFGDGMDGPLVFDGSTTITGAAGSGMSLVPASNVYTLTRDIFATTIVVNNGVTVKAAGWRILASVSITNNGTIANNGNDATGATAGGATSGNGAYLSATNGGTGVSTNATGAVGIAQNAAAHTVLAGPGGGGGGSGTGSPGAGGSTNSDGYAAKTTSGGTAGTGGSAGGAGSATLAQARAGANAFHSLPSALTGGVNGSGSVFPIAGGGGGGAGAGDGTNAAGGGGAGGGALILGAPTITNNGTISSNGGKGGNAAGGNSGGGGGGGGGPVVLTSNTFSGTAATSTGGTHGNGAGTGANGGDGGTGTVLVLQFK